MNSDLSDLLVGSMSMIVGLLFVLAAAMQWEYFYKLRKIKKIEDRWGRTVARGFFAFLGLLLIVVGLIIVNGFRIF